MGAQPGPSPLPVVRNPAHHPARLLPLLREARVTFEIAPPLTRTERWAIAIMATATILAALLISAVTEYETRRAAANWPPPHVTQERSPE